MKTVYAVLLDVMGIQRYIFESNRLKGNIGGSYLVDAIYGELLQSALEETVREKVDIHTWKSQSHIGLFTDEGKKAEVVSIGGGSALLLFKEDVGRQFVFCWTQKLLVQVPGLRTAAAHGLLYQERVKEGIDALYQQLRKNKNEIFPEVELPRHGITRNCPLSGGGAQVRYQDADGREKHISATMYAKLEAANTANQALQQRFAKELGSVFCFTDQLDELGQQAGFDYIALVHIDGNDMGKRFAACADVTARRQLSLQIAKGSEEAFRALVQDIVQEYDSYCAPDSGLVFEKRHRDGKWILPIRPIILGGDDITFVAHGQLGIAYTRRYMEHLLQQPLPPYRGKAMPFYSCAGITLMKTSYPFFRGYSLAESLCAEAKSKAREHKGGAWLDYYIVHGEVSGSLGQIRATEYAAAQGNLHFGPYWLAAEQPVAERAWADVEEGIGFFAEVKQWRHNKVKELRSRLTGTAYDMNIFLREQRRQGSHLPELQRLKAYEETGWKEQRTPYFDMVELMDFMPALARKGGKRA